jgi:hypothetical protein
MSRVGGGLRARYQSRGHALAERGGGCGRWNSAILRPETDVR